MNNEVIGIVATCFIVFAFMQSGEKKIRIMDSIGAVLFIVYGICIHSFSTVLLNSILVFIQAMKLWRMRNEEIS